MLAIKDVLSVLYLKATCPSNVIDRNMVRHKTSNIKHAYVHLSCLVIASACVLGTMNGEWSCLCFSVHLPTIACVWHP